MPARAPTRWRTGGRWRTHSARHRVSASIKPHLNAVNAQAFAEPSIHAEKNISPATDGTVCSFAAHSAPGSQFMQGLKDGGQCFALYNQLERQVFII
jgi:hypothetical protein